MLLKGFGRQPWSCVLRSRKAVSQEGAGRGWWDSMKEAGKLGGTFGLQLLACCDQSTKPIKGGVREAEKGGRSLAEFRRVGL